MIFDENDILLQVDKSIIEDWFSNNCRLSRDDYKLDITERDGETLVDMLKIDDIKRPVIFNFKQDKQFTIRKCEFGIDLGYKSIKNSPYICPEYVNVNINEDELDEFENDLKTMRPTYISTFYIIFNRKGGHMWNDKERHEIENRFSQDVLKSYMIFTDEIKCYFI